MKPFNLIVLAIALTGLSCAQKVAKDTGVVRDVVTLSNEAPATQPAEQAPKLPSGHPDISKLQAEQSAAPVPTTTTEPDWFIHMRHIMIAPTDASLQVMDMLAVENPTQLAWVGNPDGTGNKVTFTLVLPSGARDVQLASGFDPNTRVLDGKIINSTPLAPGVSQYRLQYTLPLNNGRAEIIATAPAPAPVATMMVFYPDNGVAISATGIDGPQTVNMGNGNTRYFKGENIGPGHEVKLAIGGASATAAPVKNVAPPVLATSGAELAKMVAGVGALLIFLLGGALMLIKPRNSKKR